VEKTYVHSSLDFLKVLEKYTLKSKLLTCQAYSSGIMSCSRVELRADSIMPWEIEAFATYSLVYDNDDATEELDDKSFLEIITSLRNYRHDGLVTAEERGKYSEAFIMISAQQQFSVQGVFLQKLYRYHYFFSFQNDKLDMQKVFFDKMGVNYEQLEEFAFLVFEVFSKEVRDKLPESEIRRIKDVAFSDENVVKLLSVNKEEYKKKLLSLYTNDVDQYYGLKILHLYPIISEKNFTYLPLPYLVVNAVTDSMLNRITENDDKLRRAIGKEVIESYLFDIVNQLNTVTWISPEIKYKKGRNELLTSDVIAAEGDKVIFYDAKSIVPSLRLRKFDEAEIEKDIAIYADGIVQVYKQICNYLQGLFKLDKFYSKEDIFGIVVVLEDANVSRREVYKKACETLEKTIILTTEEKDFICSHIKVCSLRSIEYMALQNTSLMPGLLQQLNEPENWYNQSYTNATTANGAIPSYGQYVRDIKNRIINRVNL